MEGDATTTADTAAADHAMRHWASPQRDDFRIGSDAHKQMFCRMLLETHNPYKPAVIEWPKLAPEVQRRLVSLPIWNIAVHTEGRASIRVRTFAATVEDDLLREALEMNGREEGRHKQVLTCVVETYGIRLAPEPQYPPPRHPTWAWIKTGYSECVDSFVAFGFFDIARRSGFVPPELVETFEPVIQEETRHILFFANWVAWHRRNLPWWRRPVFALQVLSVWTVLIRERIRLARTVGRGAGPVQKADPSLHARPPAPSLDPGAFIDICLAENERRMAGYDRRLLRPKIVPGLARFVRRFLPSNPHGRH